MKFGPLAGNNGAVGGQRMTGVDDRRPAFLSRARSSERARAGPTACITVCVTGPISRSVRWVQPWTPAIRSSTALRQPGPTRRPTSAAKRGAMSPQMAKGAASVDGFGGADDESVIDRQADVHAVDRLAAGNAVAVAIGEGVGLGVFENSLRCPTGHRRGDKPRQRISRLWMCSRGLGRLSGMGRSSVAGASIARTNGSAVGRRFGPRRRGDPDGGDLLAVAAQDLEAEAVEHEGLADLGDPLGLVQHQPGDGGGLLVGQAPVELAG